MSNQSRYFNGKRQCVYVPVTGAKNIYNTLMIEYNDKNFIKYLVINTDKYLSQYINGMAIKIKRPSEEWNKFVDAYLTLHILKMVISGEIPYYLKYPDNEKVAFFIQ